MVNLGPGISPWLLTSHILLRKKKCIQDVKTQFVVAYPNVSQVYLIKTTPFEKLLMSQSQYCCQNPM